VFTRPGFAERMLALAANGTATPPPGPSRDELLELVRSPSKKGDVTGAAEPWMPGAARG
jgi:hypothetical protein